MIFSPLTNPSPTGLDVGKCLNQEKIKPSIDDLFHSNSTIVGPSSSSGSKATGSH